MNTPDGKYDVKLPEYVGDAIEHYLKEGRPYLAGANDNDFFLLPEKFANQTEYDRAGVPIPVLKDRWNAEAIGTRVRLVTRALRDGKPGFGPHAFRHIVATDYLKRFPGAYKLVADLLCDQLQTVIKEYGHTSAQDGLNIHYTAAEAEYAAAMGGKP
jgi:integrase